MRQRLTIGIVGAGGDGVVAIGNFLQRLAAVRGYFSQMSRYYGAQIRGGGSAVKLCLNAREDAMPEDALDILVCFNWEKYQDVRHELALAEEAIILAEDMPPAEMSQVGKVYQIAVREASLEATGSDKNRNIVALGLLVRMLGLEEEGAVLDAIENDRELGLLRRNIAAFEAGQKLFEESDLEPAGLAPAGDSSERVILQGNAAVARGAIRAGCRAFFGYPITPASEIMQEMDEAFFMREGVFLQTEDEISSAAMVLGAALTGAKAITGTSGPGLDLMTEVMGLAIASETPMVIVDVQRGGPSTGIPSKSEQSDLNHAVYGGHGDAPRVVTAPMDIEGCYRLMIDSVNISEEYQTVVIMLSDQWLGQTLVATDDGFMHRDYTIIERREPERGQTKYHRYRITPDHISPVSAAGDEGLMYRTSGLTRDEDGAPSFDYETHQWLHEKRWGKLVPLCRRDDLVRISGPDDARSGILTWGSSAQFVLETIKELDLEGKLRLCVPELICPIPDAVRDFLKSLDRLLVVEMNYSGQFYHYLKSQADLPDDTRLYSRAGGRVFSVSELSSPILEVAA